MRLSRISGLHNRKGRRFTAALAAAKAVLTVAMLPVHLAAAQVSLSVSADKEVYGYGEAIEVTVAITNNTAAPFTLIGSTSCQAEFRFDDYDSFPRVCTADYVEIRFNPGAWRGWTWTLDPAEMGLPGSDGSHAIVGYYPGTELVDTVFVSAPAFLGGLLSVSTAAPVTEEQIAAVKDSLNAVVLYDFNSEHGLTEVWRVHGVTVDSAVARWGSDSRFSSFEPWRHPPGYVLTHRDGVAPRRDETSRLSVFPNPCSKECLVDFGTHDSRATQLIVYDMMGRAVASGPGTTVETRGTTGQWILDVSQFAYGIYLLAVQQGNRTRSTLLVVSE